jgi:hypothetical protein
MNKPNPSGRFNDLPLLEKALILHEIAHGCLFHIDNIHGSVHHIYSLNRYFIVMTTAPDDSIVGIDMVHSMDLPVIDMICDRVILTRSFKDNLPIGMLVDD